jgi:ABC-type sugar transport system ATPase subunit
VVYVTHDQAEAMTLSDRLVVMKDGEIQQVGTPLAVYNAPVNTFVARFLGSPAINLIPGSMQDVNGSVGFAATNTFWPLPAALARAATGHSSQELLLGMRPEDIAVSTSDDSGVPGIIDIVEPMGSLNVIYASAGESRIVATVAPDLFPAPGSRVWLVPQPDKLQLFDAETTLAIRP